MITDSVTIPLSFCFDGLWQSATWSARVVDPDTGEIHLEAYVPGFNGRAAAVRLTMHDVAILRSLAGFNGPIPAPDPSIPSTDAPCYDCRTTGERLATIERRQEEDAVTFGEHARRLDALERRLNRLEETQPPSAVDALRQIANIQSRDPDGLKDTWAELALACIGIAKKALEVHDATPTHP